MDSQRYSPFELGLDWAVDLGKDSFTGRRALLEEQRRGVRRRIVGMEVDWGVVEAFYRELGLPPEPPHVPWRSKVPVYAAFRQIGHATSGVWSPLLKRYLVIATLDSAYARLGTVVDMEVTVEDERRRAPARVVKKPFFDPPRKKA